MSYRDVGRQRLPAGRTYLINTPHAIKKFQRFHGLAADGIIGHKTRRVMRRTNTHLLHYS